MLEFIREHCLSLIFAITVFAILLSIFAFRRRRKNSRVRLKKGSSGLWQYHEDTEFSRKEAYRPRLEVEKERGSKDVGEEKKPIAIITFRGDLRAKQHDGFAKLVDEVVINKDLLSEVVVKMTSPGGLISQYGHVLSEMERLRETALTVTVCVDVVAASGGYLASLPASKIIAAPFAVVGSVGVVAFVPNFREFLTDLRIRPRTFTAGKYKRTVNLTDDAGPEEVARFQAQLESIHRQFRDLVRRYRPAAKMDEIETGDHWTAKESLELELGIVDELSTSADYLLRQNRDRDLIELSHRKGFFDEGLSQLFVSLVRRIRAAA